MIYTLQTSDRIEQNVEFDFDHFDITLSTVDCGRNFFFIECNTNSIIHFQTPSDFFCFVFVFLCVADGEEDEKQKTKQQQNKTHMVK